jgi:ketosteroid isomerase-like protein
MMPNRSLKLTRHGKGSPAAQRRCSSCAARPGYLAFARSSALRQASREHRSFRSERHTVNAAQNRATAEQFFKLFNANDVEGALALMTDDATWRIPGKKELSPTAGLYTKEKIGRLFRRMVESLSSGLRMTVISSVAEADRVALEVTSSGNLKNGRLYRQEYHFLMEFRDGCICAVREYLDTQHAHDVWIASVSSQERPSSAEPPPRSDA